MPPAGLSRMARRSMPAQE